MFKAGRKSAEHQCAIWNAQHAGKDAFTSIGNHGYLTSSIRGKRYTAHRVAWAIFRGEWPEGEIDHVNHNRTDNRMHNLRHVSRSENARNLSRATNNPSGVTGVYWYEPTRRWVAKIHENGRMRHLGYFTDKDAAVSARIEAQSRLGFHKNHGAF